MHKDTRTVRTQYPLPNVKPLAVIYRRHLSPSVQRCVCLQPRAMCRLRFRDAWRRRAEIAPHLPSPVIDKSMSCFAEQQATAAGGNEELPRTLQKDIVPGDITIQQLKVNLFTCIGALWRPATAGWQNNQN